MSFLACPKLALAWSTILRRLVMALTAFWCLSDAVLKATSSAVIWFLFSFVLVAWFPKMLTGSSLKASGLPPVGKFTCGNLLLL